MSTSVRADTDVSIRPPAAEVPPVVFTESVRTLIRHANVIREEERARIARELHDEVGHVLVMMKFLTASLSNNEGSGSESVMAKLRSVERLTDRAIRSVRRLASGLSPMLCETGLIAASRACCDDFGRRTGISCVFATNCRPDAAFDASKSLVVFRVLQAALANVAQHARARRVEVVLNRTGSHLTLVVRDDGVGMPDAAGSAAGSPRNPEHARARRVRRGIAAGEGRCFGGAGGCIAGSLR